MPLGLETQCRITRFQHTIADLRDFQARIDLDGDSLQLAQVSSRARKLRKSE